MKVAIQTSPTDLSMRVAKQLSQKCQQAGYAIVSDDPDLIISVGGDGTLLSAFHRYKAHLDHSQFAAVHTGHLGFYTDFLANQLDELLALLAQSERPTYSYPLLEIAIKHRDGKVRKRLALNEFTLKTISGMLVCEVYIGDKLFEIYRGDGLCLATPTGSTGVSKSLGGAVLHPSLEAMQLVEMASLNNRVYKTVASPLVLPKTDVVTLKIKRAIAPVVTIDNLEPDFIDCHEVDSIEIKLADQRIHFVDHENMDFWERVESSFIGDINREALSVKPSNRRYKYIKDNSSHEV